MLVKCDECGKELSIPPSRIKASKTHFCNRACYTKWQNAVIKTLSCDECGTQFTRYLTKMQRSEHNFCSRLCYERWQSHERVGPNHHHWLGDMPKKCDECGKEFRRVPSQARGHDHLFCSNSCRGKWLAKHQIGEDHPLWEGGRIRYERNWRKQRDKARERDVFTCQHCGITEERLGKKLHVHHIVPLRQCLNRKESGDLSNLISLCPKCHKVADSGQKSQR